MKNENRAVFDCAPEPIDYAFEPAAEDTGGTDNAVLRSPAGNSLARFTRWLEAWLCGRRNAAALLELSDEQLKDIGVSRCQAYGGYSRYRQSNACPLERLSR